MRAPGFWDEPGHPLAMLLAPLGRVYGAVTAARMARPGARAPLPVICVGNFVAGGAGKTPVALALAERLRALGRRPVFLSRGYGGRIRAPMLVDPARQDAAETGDEPQLLAAVAPTVVSPRREAGVTLAAAAGDVIVMDDGLQNPGLAKTLSLAVFDGATGLGNGLCLPAGPLRAPAQAQWHHVAAAIILGEGAPGEAVAQDAVRHGVAVLHARLVPGPEAGALVGRRVLAFAGIGRPGKFFDTLEAVGAEVAARRSFPDHAPYTPEILAGLRREASRGGLALVTTAKDVVRLKANLPGETLDDIAVLGVTAVFAEPERLDALLAGALRGA